MAAIGGLTKGGKISLPTVIGGVQLFENNLTGFASAIELLTIAEVALSLILLVGAGLLLRSFSTLMGVNLGFQTDRVIAMNISLPILRYPDAQARLLFFQRLEERVHAVPGVVAVGTANRMPLRGGWSSGIAIDGKTDRIVDPDFQAVTPGYFETLGIPLLRGRWLNAQDTANTLPIAVVNQAFARQLLDGADPIGHTMQRKPRAPRISMVWRSRGGTP